MPLDLSLRLSSLSRFILAAAELCAAADIDYMRRSLFTPAVFAFRILRFDG